MKEFIGHPHTRLLVALYVTKDKACVAVAYRNKDGVSKQHRIDIPTEFLEDYYVEAGNDHTFYTRSGS